MRGLTIVGVMLLALPFVLARPDDGKYTSKYDNLDIDEILGNKRLLKNYVNCLLEKGSCTPDAAELKKVLPEAIDTECAKCSDKQKDGSKKVLRYLVKNEPEIWTELENKYDPTGSYKTKYCALAKEEGEDTGDKC